MIEDLVSWDGGFVLWDQNCPVYNQGSVWERVGSSVEDAEPSPVVGGGMLSWWGKEFLDAS